MKRTSLAIQTLFILGLFGCGETATEPVSLQTVAGDWAGTLTFVANDMIGGEWTGRLAFTATVTGTTNEGELFTVENGEGFHTYADGRILLAYDSGPLDVLTGTLEADQITGTVDRVLGVGSRIPLAVAVSR